MATQKIQTLDLNTSVATTGLWSKYMAFVDSQKSNSMFWWLGSLMLHGCLLVPLTFLMVYTLDGPSLPFLFISLISFFINIIANMGGAGFRFTFSSLVFSILVHALMIITTLISVM